MPRSARNAEEGVAVLLLRHVVRGAARLAGGYIAAGFVHGVLNSDNINVTAESFDYGPWRWTPYWEPQFTAAYFDHAGLYAFGRQPEAIHWNLVQLAIALRKVAEADVLTAELEVFPHLFQEGLRDAIFARLGIAAGALAEDMKLVAAIEEALGRGTVPIDRFFFDWRGGAPRNPLPVYDDFGDLRALMQRHAALPGATDHAYWSDAAPCSMHIEEVEAIWARIDEADDWSALHAKVAAVRRMGEAMRPQSGQDRRRQRSPERL